MYTEAFSHWVSPLLNVVAAEKDLFGIGICAQRWALQGTTEVQVLQWETRCYCKFSPLCPGFGST